MHTDDQVGTDVSSVHNSSDRKVGTTLRVVRNPTDLRLLDYHIIAGLNSFACSLFLLSIFFWSRERYDFTNTENLLLGAVQGICYIISARIGGRLSDRWGHHRLLVVGLAGMAFFTLTGWIPEYHAMPYLVLAGYTIFMGGTWPSLMSGVMHLPGKFNVPQRLGIYNLVWSFSGTLGFFMSGFIFTRDADSILWITGIIHVIQLGWIFYHRNRHVVEGSSAMTFPHIGNEKSREVKDYLTRLSWLSNSVGYFLAGSFSALTPHLGVKLGLSQTWTIWLGASLLGARGIGFLLLRKWDGWHYSYACSLVALWSAPLLLAMVFFSNSIPVVAIACLLLGLSLGLSYYMSIYYSLDARDEKGGQGGLHESIIGMGVLFGPLTGAVGGYLTGTTIGAKATIVISALIISAIGLTLLKTRRG
jgi:predicted MFS family arabinose efflux permease